MDKNKGNVKKATTKNECTCGITSATEMPASVKEAEELSHLSIVISMCMEQTEILNLQHISAKLREVRNELEDNAGILLLNAYRNNEIGIKQ